jgi:hypothetical protein
MPPDDADGAESEAGGDDGHFSKRSLGGTYVSVEPFHLFRYVDEQAFRYNHRKHENGDKKTDAERFEIAVSQIVGKRLTYAELTGNEEEAA